MSIRFSILIPAFNREKYVRQAIDSGLSQDFPDSELIAIDDGSTDQTLQVMESYGTRIKVLRQANSGPEVARNKAAAVARGEYLVFLDSDDLLLPGALATYDQVIRTFDSPPLVIGAMTRFQDGGPVPVPSRPSAPLTVLKYRDFLSNDARLWISSSRIVLRRSVFDEIGGLRNTKAQTFHLDSLNLMLKLGTYGPCVIVQQPSTVAYRHHKDNTICDVEAIANGILGLASAELRGEYPGGVERRAERQACIGAMSLNWALKQGLLKGHIALPLRLLSRTVPMGLAALRRKAMTCFREPTAAITLSPHDELISK
jgi:glycosyltransferase involved in cell wall biosynthesis